MECSLQTQVTVVLCPETFYSAFPLSDRSGFGCDGKGEGMKRILTLSLVNLILLAVGCCSVWAQATAEITGTVRDQSGAVLPGVEVTATQTNTGISRTGITNETGSYILPNLAVGPYRLEAALPGFRTFVQTGIVLQVNSNPVI